MKRICMFLDGSAVSAAIGGMKPFSNVFRMNLAIHFEDDAGQTQQAFYLGGVGTRGDRFSGASGRGLNEIISEAYISISSNYQQGDTIYLFGWSRGAAAARTVAGLITKVGLLGADFLHYLDAVWQLYRITQRDEQSEIDLTTDDRQRKRELQATLWGKLWIEDSAPKIRLLGLFDTVPGNSWDVLRAFSDVDFYEEPLERSAEVGIQLLSIDDRRLPSYKPLLWKGRHRPDQVVEQIWMPGVHADVGGNSGCGLLADASLLTMIDRVQTHCPELKFAQWNINALQRELGAYRGPHITNERGGPRYFLWTGYRSIGQVDPSTEYLHPLAAAMIGTKIRLRSGAAVYAGRNISADMQPAQMGKEAERWWNQRNNTSAGRAADERIEHDQ